MIFLLFRLSVSLRRTCAQVLLMLCFALAVPQLAKAAGAGTSGDPFTALADAYTVSTGRYYFDIGSGSFQADVDNDEGGGWVLVLQYVHQGGTNPALSITGAGADLPVTSAAALGTDESADTTKWGHAGNGAMSQFTGDIELRWYGETSAHGRRIHFRSTAGDDYVRTGGGNFGGIETGFTTLAGHSANIPGTVNGIFSNSGDYALTNFPFFQGATYHWGVRGSTNPADGGNGTRWEVDDFPSNSANSTIHRVWVRSVDVGRAVINTDDTGEGSLRDAITYANANTGEDAVVFNIPGTGPHTITLASALPTITDAGVSIDGTTQTGAACSDLWSGVPHTLKVRIDDGGSIGNGLEITGAGVSVRGLSVTGFNYGLVAQPASDGATFQCNHVGLAPDGTTAANFRGIWTNGSNMLVGGPSAGDGNVVSGNAYGIQTSGSTANVRIQGNFIGTDPTGTAARANTNSGFANHVGTATIDEIRGNLVSGNNTGFILNSDDTWTGVGGADLVIAGNYIGTDRTGNAPLPNTLDGIDFTAGTVTDLVIGGTGAGDRNVISGNGDSGIAIDSASDIVILGNIIGLGADGSTDVGNDEHGLLATGSGTVTIGNGTASGRNIISSNGFSGLEYSSGSGTLFVLGNHIGTDEDGLVARRNGADQAATSQHALSVFNASNATVTIDDNVIAYHRTAIILFGGTVTDATITRNRIGIGATGATLAGSGESGTASAIYIQTTTTNPVTIGGSDPADANVISGVTGHGIQAGGGSTVARGNTIRSASGYGVSVLGSTTTLAIVANEISDSGILGIDFDYDTTPLPNDAGDGDTGPNELLNYPVIAQIVGDGTTAMEFDFTLDVPSNLTHGYRVDFFKNTVSESHGEGEIHLGAVTVAHGGGNLRYTGTLTANAAVSAGDFISTTATRATSGTTYDITSEFSATVAASPPPDPLIVTSTADTDTVGTLRYAINHANANAGEDAITFAVPGTGPHTITLTSNLPIVTDAGVSIDGTTQDGASCGDLWAGTPHTLMIRVHGAGNTTHGLQGATSNVAFKGLSITQAGAAITSGDGSTGITVTCSYLGLAPDGSASSNNNGVLVRHANMMIGGLSAGEGNVISSNNIGIFTQFGSSNTVIRGNFIGTDPTGLIARANTTRGINHSGGPGTWGDITRNLISGNNSPGITLESDDAITGSSGDVVIAGNYIGTDRTGTASLPNNGNGILFASGSISGVTMGGTTAADRNVISGNTGAGLSLTGLSDIDILGNTIGLGADGSTDLGNGRNGIRLAGGTGVTIGDGTTGGRNVISGNTEHGIFATGTIDGIVIDGNHIGVAADGITARGNGASYNGSGVHFDSGVVSDGEIIRGNVIAANGIDGIEINGTVDNLTVTGNYIGTDSTGTVDLSGGYSAIDISSTGGGHQIGAAGAGNVMSTANAFDQSAALYLENTVTSATVQGNSIGLGADGSTVFGSGSWGIRSYADNTTIGGTGAGEGNTIVGTDSGWAGLLIQGGGTATVSGNTIRDGFGYAGVDVTNNGTVVTFHDNTITGEAGDGIKVGTGAQLRAYANTITGNAGDGVLVSGTTAQAALYGNAIHSNGGLGIDLNGGTQDANGVTANDAGDGDTGPNGLLNYPVINSFTANGTTSVAFDITLDVPGNGNGYRVEFFSNTIADASGHGEGETYLGHVDVAGSGIHSGSFTANASVSVGEYISATTTRKTGASTYDITSEFSLTYTSFTADPAVLVATKVVAVIDDGLVNGDDSTAIPGATLRYLITIRNDGAGPADTDATVIVDEIPAVGSLKVIDFGGGVGTGPVGVSNGSPSSGLTYSYSSLGSGTDDIDFSDDGGATWTYTPINVGDGTDPSVTHIRLSPSGAFNGNGGTPPTLSIGYDIILF